MMTSCIKTRSDDLSEGDTFYVLVDNEPILAELYTKKNDKWLIRHSDWEWIDSSSSRLFPLVSKNKLSGRKDRNDGDEDKDDEDDEDEGDKVMKLNILEMEMELNENINNENVINNNNNDYISGEDIASCEKVLLKVSKNPQLLLTKPFNKFSPHIQTLYEWMQNNNNNNHHNNDPESLQFSQKRLEKYQLRMEDFEKQAQTGIRQQRIARKKESDAFREFINGINQLEQQKSQNALEIVAQEDPNDIKKKLQVTNNEIFHGQVLITCEEKDLSECLTMIERNVPLLETTTFKVGTLIRDSNGSQRLDLCKQKLGPSNARVVADVMKRNQCISALLLGANGIGDQGAQAIAEMIEVNNHVETVFLGCNLIKHQGISALANALKNNTSVRGLWLKRNPLGLKGAIEIAQMLAENTHLRTIDLVSTGITEKGLQCIIEALLSNPNSVMQQLFLGALNISSAFVSQHITRLINHCSHITDLFLTSNPIGDSGAIALAQAMYHAPQLRLLSLRSCNIGPDGCEALSLAMGSHPNLEDLDLGYAANTKPVGALPNHIGDEGMKMLADSLAWIADSNRSSKLYKLSVERNGITEMGGMYLLRVLKTYSNFQPIIFKLGFNQISFNTLQEIKTIAQRNRKIQRSETEKDISIKDTQFDVMAVRSVYRNPLQKQFCPSMVKTKNDEILDFLSSDQVLQCHSTANNRDNVAPKQPPTERNTTIGLDERKDEKEKTNLLTTLRQIPIKKGKKSNITKKIQQSSIKNKENLHFIKSCYICKQRYNQLHPFYDKMCRSCGDLNYAQRLDRGEDLNGKVAVVTGGRVKIGYEIVLKLLRQRCRVVVTTRFPKYTALRYGRESDFTQWKDHLCIYGMDFLDIKSVFVFIKWISQRYSKIDILINNAAVTIHRASSFYEQVLAVEKQTNLSITKQYSAVSEIVAATPPRLYLEGDFTQNKLAIDKNAMTTAEGNESQELKPELNLMTKKEMVDIVVNTLGNYDEHNQPLDLRDENSWTAVVGSIHPIEIMQTIVVNQYVPFLLINHLLPLLSRGKDNEERSYIINVSAMEGRFNHFKRGTHPHTNMAKAALNMLTRSSGEQMAQQHSCYMVSVDTGWVTDELPLKKRVRSNLNTYKFDKRSNIKKQQEKRRPEEKEEEEEEEEQKEEKEEQEKEKQEERSEMIFHPPLDEIDGAARVLHPIWCGLRGNPYTGVFLKDYGIIDW